MAWKAIGEARFRSYQEYRDMEKNLTSVQELCTEQFLRIQDLKRELAEKNEMLDKLMAIALLTNPQGAHTFMTETGTSVESGGRENPSKLPALPEADAGRRKTG